MITMVIRNLKALLVGIRPIRIGLGLIMLAFYLNMLPDIGEVFGPNGLIFRLSPRIFYEPESHFIFSYMIIAAGIWTAIWLVLTQNNFLPVLALILTNVTFLLVSSGYVHFGWAHAINYFILLSGIYAVRPSPIIIGLFKFQVILIYLKAALPRIFDPGWLDGKMGLVALTSVFSRWPGYDWLPYSGLIMAATHLGWGLELFSPLLLGVSRLRKFSLPIYICMHVCIEITMHVGMWSFFMLVILAIFFIRTPNLESKSPIFFA